MPTLTADGQNAACDGYVDTLNLGTIVFHTAAHAEVATCTFANPAFGAAAAGVATAGAITSDPHATGGTANHVHILKSDSTDMGSYTCAVGSGEFNMNAVIIPAGAIVQITAGTITMPTGP